MYFLGVIKRRLRVGELFKRRRDYLVVEFVFPILYSFLCKEILMQVINEILLFEWYDWYFYISEFWG